MCGIIGIIGCKENLGKKLLSCIKKLEYRGYDSSGIVSITNNKILVKKDVGKIDEVDKKVNFSELNGNVGLAHTRWATCGDVTKENAHPHTDCKDKISIVHNGIIENYSELKEMLLAKGHFFTSETDTEIIAHLIEDHYNGNLKEATIKALKQLQGSYALGIISSENPDIMIAARNESPLIIGIGKDENFIASDVPAILEHTKNVIFLEDKQIAVLKKDEVEIFDLEDNKLKKDITKIEWNAEQAEKQGFDHFMQKEIFEQPRAIEETMLERLTDKEVNLKSEINLKDEQIKNIRKIVIVACGTSWHAGLIGKFILEGLARIPTEVEYASEFRYKDPILNENDLVIAISQSGETADTLAAVREAKKNNIEVISICNAFGSSIPRISDSTLYTKAGPEIGVASTKAFTTQLIVLYLLTLHFGKIRNTISKRVIEDAIKNLRKIPLQMQSVLEDEEYIINIAKKFYNSKNALFLGRGPNFPIALEGALKLKEISYIHAEGYPAAEMKHGPIALIDKNMPVVFIATKDIKTYPKVLANIEEVKARGGIVIAITTKGDLDIKKKVDYNFHVPQNLYTLSPILAVVPLQLLAYHIACLRGCDVDRPRNLAKSCTVE